MTSQSAFRFMPWTFAFLSVFLSLSSQARSFEDFKPCLYTSSLTLASNTNSMPSSEEDLRSITSTPAEDTSTPLLLSESSTFFSFKSVRTRKYILFPALGSFVLPGLDQWLTGQTSAGMFYSGYALAGYGATVWAAQKINNEDLINTETDSEGGMPTEPTHQLLSVAAQATMAAGFLSAYHSFRTYAESSGDTRYAYIKNNGDTMEGVMLAPFKFKFLARPTTIVPLLLAGALLASNVKDDNARKVAASDTGFLAATSYQAGVGEEAFFRGFLYPYMTTTTDSEIWGSIISSVIFGAAHISSDNPVPVVQTLFGFYDAYVTHRNNWSIQESTFIHFWWDVIVLAAAYSAAPESRLHYNKNIINFAF